LFAEGGVGRVAWSRRLTCGRIIAIRVLLLLATFAVLYSCDQVNSPVKKEENQGKKEGVEQQPEPEKASMPAGEQAAQAEASCRLTTYVSNENMSNQEGDAFAQRVSDQMTKEIEEGAAQTSGTAEIAALDHFDVPRYPECSGEREKTEAPAPTATVKCSDFSDRKAARTYSQTRATQADREVLDPNNDGKACNEGGYDFASEPASTSSATTSATASASASATANASASASASPR
jgi:hypothetical protein